MMTLILALAVQPAAAVPCGFHDDLVPPAPNTQTSTFENDAAITWTLDSSDSHVGWHVTPAPGRNPGADAVGHTSPVRLYYGSSNTSASPNYFTRDDRNQGTAISPPIVVPSGATDVVLVFNTKYEVEARNPAIYDQMAVHLSYNDGASWYPVCSVSPGRTPDGHLAETVCSNGTPEGAYPCFRDPSGQTHPVWETRRAPIGGEGALRVRFSFDTVDALENEAMGWMIDDIQIAYTPPVAPPTPPTPEEVPAMNSTFFGVLVAGLALAGGLAARKTRP